MLADMETVIGFFLWLLAIGLQSGDSLHALVLPETDSHRSAGHASLQVGDGGQLGSSSPSPLTTTTTMDRVLMEERIVPSLVFQHRCADGFFRCNSTLDCIEQRRNCDKVPDCEDGSDERDCDDNVDSWYWDHLFRKRPGALNDHLPFTSCAWNDFNISCKCRVTEVLCDYKGFTVLPTSLPMDNVTLLDLTGNRFPVLNMNVFEKLPALDTLVLKHCSIEEIEPPARTLNDIYALHLDQNKLKSLPDIFFPPNTWLHILILSGNQITKLTAGNFANLDFLEELDLRDNLIESLEAEVLRPLRNLDKLYLNNNKLTKLDLGMIPILASLRTLSLARNQIRTISVGALNLPKLEHLYLSENRLRMVANNTFSKLPNLLGLFLNDNEISHFQLGSFAGINNLTTMNLQGNKFTRIDSRVLQNLTSLNHIHFSEFHHCKAALHVRVCDPKGDGISSKSHLLDNPVLRASVWIMAAVGIIGNLLVLFGRYMVGTRSSQAHAEHSLYLRHLAASDLMMGIYLAIIATADIMFRGQYLLYEEEWRASGLCAFSGFLSTLSCQSSTLLLTLVTWDRLISVTRPLYQRSGSKTRVILRLALLWGVAASAAAAPLSATDYFGPQFYGTNGVCLSIHIHDPYAMGWEYSAGLFILVNTFSLLFIGTSYLRMLQAIRVSRNETRNTLNCREKIVARRFAIIVATDCLCWMPVIVVKLVALGGVQISPSLYAWLAVMVLPVNSALNPVLYTLTTAQFKQQLTRFFYSLPCGASHELNGYDSAIDSRNSLGQMTYSTTANGSTRRIPQRKDRASINTKVYEFK
ncbi:relaxin receptor 2 [Aedes aegypti]|uniref:G-protein coupled receptors family 1 profile domain-containing protein n=1 Tax=Aedes aegypti TaxID=7159 RepID=A0A6R5I923_AEDAE|nr:relaxin receptor 2 [Aedes aegypti]